MEQDDRTIGYQDEDFGAPLVDGALPPFWKPDVDGEKKIGEVTAIRHAKIEGRDAMSVTIMGADGLDAIPIGAGLENVNWPKQIGRVLMFTFKGWEETKSGRKVRVFEVRPLRSDVLPF